MPQLAAVMRLQMAAGRRLFLIAATPESSDELDQIIAAVGVDQVMVVCLTVPGTVAASRVGDRDPDRWPGKAGLMAHAEVLADLIPGFARIDLTIDTAATDLENVATAILAEMRVRELIAAQPLAVDWCPRPPGYRPPSPEAGKTG